ncbi:hypothetical protein D3C76_1523000 [compost metagenome]
MYRIGHFAPALNVCSVVDPRGIQIAAPFFRNRHAFGDKQPRRGALGVVKCNDVIRHVVHCAGAGHRGHDHAVF